MGMYTPTIGLMSLSPIYMQIMEDCQTLARIEVQ